MLSFQRFIEGNAAFIQLIAGTIATMITLTAFAYSTFVTKEQLKDNEGRIKEMTEYRLSRLEEKIDKLDDKLDYLIKKGAPQ